MAHNLKDKRLRYAVHTFTQRTLFLKACASNEFLPRVIRECAQNYLSINRKLSKTKIENRCIETSRSRSVIRAFQFSRSRFRLRAETGFLLGVRRSSW